MIKNTKFQYSYISTIVILQLIILLTTQSPVIQWVSGIAGAVYVASLTFNKWYTFLFAIVFNGTMLVIGVQHGILSEMIQQPLFIIMGILGFLHMNYHNKFKFVNKSLDYIKSIKPVYILTLSVIVIVLWTMVSKQLGSPIWWKDGLLGGIAISAQLFSIVGNKYSWFYWIALNGLTSWTWYTLSTPNIAMGSLYLIFLINAVFGFVFWKLQEKE